MTGMARTFRLKFWGTRGSIPSPGSGTLKYGGNTSCLEVRCGNELIIIDAGTGIRGLGIEILKAGPVKASILFSHMHWDHIQGIPFFQPVYVPGNEFKVYGGRDLGANLESALKCQMQSPNFPVTLEAVNEVGARMEYVDIDAGTMFQIGHTDPITITSVELNHPNKALGFRIEYGGRSLVYATDTENLPEPDRNLAELASGADLLIHDAQYTNEEYYGLDGGGGKINWGHSTPEAATAAAIASDVKQLVLFHHDPYHKDDLIDQMLQESSAIFPNTIAASEGMIIDLHAFTEQATPNLKETDTPGLGRSSTSAGL